VTTETNESFEGFTGGAVYDWLARLTGYGPSYYRKAALAMPIQPGIRLLDLGCGTGSLTLAAARRLDGDGAIEGIDLSEKQLRRARTKTAAFPVSVTFRQGSVRELPYQDDQFDGVFASQVFHALPDEVRADAIAEAARVLRPGGFFALVEWSRPRLGYTAAIWTLTILGSRRGHNWQGTYADLIEPAGFRLLSDVYLDSLNRCQVFAAV